MEGNPLLKICLHFIRAKLSMIDLASEIKQKLEGYENFPLIWDKEEYMDLITTIAERKDYYLRLSFVKEITDLGGFKVWELKNLELLGVVIDQVERKQLRKRR